MDILLITRTQCTFCEKAKALLQEKGLKYRELEIGRDIEREQVLEMYPNVKYLPIISVNATYIGGYEDLQKYLEPLTEDRAILAKLLDNKVVAVTFIKKDGTKREMLCTRNRELIPEDQRTKGSKINESVHAPNLKLMTVYDVEKDAWRSFNIDTVCGVTFQMDGGIDAFSLDDY